MHDDKEIAIQLVDPALEQADRLLVMIKQYHPSTWELDTPVEVWVNRSSTLDQFADVLSAKINLPKERIDCTKISSPWNFHRIMLPFVDWTGING